MMLKKVCSAILSALLLQAAAAPALAGTNTKKEAERAEKVHAQLSKLGTGRDARVRVELQDETKLEGYLSEAGADSFSVTARDRKTTNVPHPQGEKGDGDNPSNRAEIAHRPGAG